MFVLYLTPGSRQSARVEEPPGEQRRREAEHLLAGDRSPEEFLDTG